MHTPLQEPGTWVVLTMLSIAAVTDHRTGLIPNAVVACGAVAGVLAQLVGVALGKVTLWLALQQMGFGLMLGASVPLVLYALGALGGGDVKLFAAIGLCLGPSRVLAIELWSQLIACAFVLIQLLQTGALLRTLRSSGRLMMNMVVPARRRKPLDRSTLTSLRLAPAILAAALWVCVLRGAVS